MITRLMTIGTATTVLFGACTPGRPSAGGSTEPADVAATVRGLCVAELHATQGDRGRAADSFESVHQELHLLAAEVQEKDPRAAGGLLEAKERVETAIDDGSGRLAGLIRTLIHRARAAATAVGRAAPACEFGP